jgi:hypothetical protein
MATAQFDTNAVNANVSFTATVALSSGGTVSNNAVLQIGSPPPPVPASLSLSINPLSINILGTSVITATVLDSGGNPAYNTNITLDLIVSAGTTTLGSFSATGPLETLSLLTDSSGQITATFYAGSSSGTAQIKATATAALPAPIAKTGSLSITSAPNSVSVDITPGTINNAGTSNITATVLNLLGKPVPDGTVVSFSIFAGTPGTGTFPATATTVNGIASITFTADKSKTGTSVIQASAGTAPNVQTGTASITVQAAATSSIEFVNANPDIIGIQGSGPQDNSTVTFLVKDNNGNPKANVPVTFTLFGPTGAYIGSGTTDTSSSAADGTVFTILHAGPVAGPARIMATVTGSSPAISTSSGNISIGGGVPSETHFDLATSQFNLEGFGFDNIQATITAYMADRFGNYNILKGTSVSFVTDAGGIDTSAVTNDTGIASAVYWTMNPRPADVAPLISEPSYSYLGHTYNPRDGWITIVAMTTGEESFVDENANGVYDSGETFTDIGEPFIDSNDNGVRDTGEQFFDWPSTGLNPVPGAVAGTYQTGNSQWDGKIPIWKTINLVYTGPPDVGSTAMGILTSRIECTDSTISPLLYGNVSIPKGQSRTFNVYVSDFNMNTLIKGTTIDVKRPTGTKGTLMAPSTITLPDVLSYGPTFFTVRLLNDITDSTPQFGDFYVEVNWKGIKTDIYYPGTITLAP